jgi:hypothetical protein
MKIQLKNTKKEKARWVEAEKILCAIEKLGYEVDALIETTKQKPKQWTLIFKSRKKEKSYLKELSCIVDVIGKLKYDYKYAEDYTPPIGRRVWSVVFTKRAKK